MKVTATVDGAALLAELKFALHATPQRSRIPITTHVRMDVHADSIDLIGTDFDVFARGQCDAKADGEAVIAIPARFTASVLADVIADSKDATVTITVDADDTAPAITLATEESQIRIRCMSAACFVTVPALSMDSTNAFPSRELLEAIRRIGFAISRENHVFNIKGALLETTTDAVRLVATDGHRLSIASFVVEDGANPELSRRFIPQGVLSLLQRIGGESVSFRSTVSGQVITHQHFVSGHRSITATEVAPNFPDYRKVIPNFDKKVVVNAEAMVRAIRRISHFANKSTHAICLNVDPSMVTLTSVGFDDDRGSAQATIAASYSGEPVWCGANAEYLLQFFRSVRGAVEISIGDQLSAIVARPLDADGEHIHVVMPLRLDEPAHMQKVA